jgi:hypothetical protein
VLSTGDGNSEKLFFLLYVFSFLSSEYGEDKTEELFSDFFNVDAKVFTQMQEIMNLPLQKTNVVQS